MKILNKSPPNSTLIDHRSTFSHSLTSQSLPMAIPLKKFAEQCEEVAFAKGKITPLSAPIISLHDISREWRNLCNATSFKSENLPDFSEKEEGAAEVIIAALTYLQRIGCKDIEKLLRDTLERHRRQTL